MKTILGLALVVLGIVGGLYVGVYVMLVGGIIQLISSITPIIIASGIAIGIARVLLASFVGWLIFIVCLGMGKALL